MTFELPVTEQRVKPHQVTALHLLCAMVFVGAGAIFHRYYLPHKWIGLVLLIAGFSLFIIAIAKNRWLRTRQVNIAFRVASLVVLLVLAGFTAVHAWRVPTAMFGILALAVIFALYWENSAIKALQIRIDDTGIKLPMTSRRRFIEWKEVEQVLFRFGTLTINCQNERLFQWTIGPVKIDAQQLESYCSTQVEAHRREPIANDW